MAKHATPRQRRAWLRWHERHGRNVSATCRQFNISRSTFYRWQRRAIETPKKPLRRRPSPRHPRLAPQQALFLERVIELSRQRPRWGARRIRNALLAMRSDVPAESTIGRWLAQMFRRCPVCDGPAGRHHEGLHALRHDLTMFESAPRIRYQKRRRRTSAEIAVEQAEAIIDRERRRCPSCGFPAMFVTEAIESCPRCRHRREL